MMIKPKNKSEENVLKRLELSNHIAARGAGPVLIAFAVLLMVLAGLSCAASNPWRTYRLFLGLALLLPAVLVTFVIRERQITLRIIKRLTGEEEAPDSQQGCSTVSSEGAPSEEP